MHVQHQAATPYVGTAAAGAQVVVTITGVAGKKFKLCSLTLGYSVANAAATVRATVADGTTTVGIPVISSADFVFQSPIEFASGATVTITLPAGAGTSVGDVFASGYFDT